jgi:acyl-CoA thioester hydrolase
MPDDSNPVDLTRRDVHAHWTRDVLRYADTDRQGHINNAVFATFLESGRVGILYNPEKPLAPEGTSFVIARLNLDFRGEMHWPNEVAIGTSVTRLGNSSVTFSQGIFIGDNCVATGETVIVLMDEKTRKSCPLPDRTRDELMRWRART